MTIKITCPADVPNLGWVGNYRDDALRFKAVDDYIRQEPDLRKRQEADLLASIHGMGMECKIDPDYDPRDSLGGDDIETILNKRG